MARSIALIIVAIFCLEFCYAQGPNWPKLTNVTIVDVPPQVFRTLTSTTLKSIPPLAFYGLLPAQMQEIPPSALAGLTSRQMEHIRPLVCGVFSVDQTANFSPTSCNGFQPECIRVMSLQTFTAFTPRCVANFPYYMIGMLSVPQFTSIQPPSLRSLKCDQTYQMDNHLVSAITPWMLSNLSRACCFVDGRRVHHLHDDAIKAITSSCIEEAGSDIFANIGVRKFLMMPKRAYSGIRYDQALVMDKRIVEALTLEDLLDTLSGTAMLGLLTEPSVYRELMHKHGMNLIRNLTVAHVLPETYQELDQIRASISQIQLDPKVFVVHWNEISHRLETTNWLEVYYLGKDTPSSVFTDSAVTNMMDWNFFGLTKEMFLKVPPHLFKHATVDSSRIWPSEFFNEMTLDIFKELPVDVFITKYQYIYRLPIDWIPYIPVGAIPHLDLSYLNCEMLPLFTPAQLAVMTSDQQKEMRALQKYCDDIKAPHDQGPNGAPYNSPVHNETPSTENVPMTTPGNSGVVVDNPGLTVGGVFAIIFAVFVVIQSSVIGYHIYNKRKNSAGLRQYDQL